MVHLWASNRVATMNVAAAVAAGGPSHFVGPFSGANAACSYLPLQLALRPEVRKLMIRPGKRSFSGQKTGKGHFVREKACFPDAYLQK